MAQIMQNNAMDVPFGSARWPTTLRGQIPPKTLKMGRG